MAQEKINIKAQAKYYQCRSKVLNYIESEIRFCSEKYEKIGEYEYTDKETGEIRMRDKYDYVSKEYDELSADDKALIDAWYLVYTKMSKM